MYCISPIIDHYPLETTRITRRSLSRRRRTSWIDDGEGGAGMKGSCHNRGRPCQLYKFKNLDPSVLASNQERDGKYFISLFQRLE